MINLIRIKRFIYTAKILKVVYIIVYINHLIPTHNWQFDEDTFGHWLYSDDDWHFKKEK